MFWTLYFYSLIGVVVFILLNLYAFQRSYPEKTGIKMILCWWCKSWVFIIASFLFITAWTHIINIMTPPPTIQILNMTFGSRTICLLSGLTVETLINLLRRSINPIKVK